MMYKNMKWRNAYILVYERVRLVNYKDEDENAPSSKNIIADLHVEALRKGDHPEVKLLPEIENKIKYEN